MRCMSRLTAMLATVPRSGLWLLLGAFALLGLFAMHGLGGHGSQHGTPASAHDGGHHDAAVGGLTHHHQESAASTVAVDDSGCSQGNCADGLVLILCLAVLAAGVAAALYVVLLRPAVVAATRPLAALVTLARSARERDPPCLFDLSIQRC
jgi:hypothetical protein